MYKHFTFICLLVLVGCAKTVDPTPDNINKIFASQDFTFEFHPTNGICESLSFANDVLVYKSDQPTIRREITYDEVVLINTYIQNIVNLHSNDLDVETSSYYVVKNTAYTATILPKIKDINFESLIKKLQLK